MKSSLLRCDCRCSRSPRSPAPALAALNVFATVPEWGALARGARRRQGQGLRRDQRAAGPASRRGEAQPHRARAQRRPRRRDRRRARGRLAAARHAAGGQPDDPARQARLLRGRGFVTLLDKPTRLDRAEGDVHPGGNPHIQTDPRNIARVAGAARRAPRRARSRERRVLPRRATRRSPSAGARRSRTGSSRRRRSRASPIVVQHKAFTYLDAWLGLERGRGARAQARRRADDRAPVRGARAAAAAAGEDGAARRLPERPRVAVARRAREDHAVVLPFTVGGDDGAKDLFGLFDDTIARLLKGAQ